MLYVSELFCTYTCTQHVFMGAPYLQSVRISSPLLTFMRKYPINWGFRDFFLYSADRITQAFCVPMILLVDFSRTAAANYRHCHLLYRYRSPYCSLSCTLEYYVTLLSLLPFRTGARRRRGGWGVDDVRTSGRA